MSDARRRLERDYQRSDQYIADSLQWVADFGHENSMVVAVACAAYGESGVFKAVVDDALDGEQRW